MKILILVLSCLDEPFDDVMRTQQETWDSIHVDGVNTLYYYGGGSGIKVINDNIREFGGDVVEDYDMMHRKFSLALNEVISEDWDYIFRTNTSSYVDKTRLFDCAKKLPTEKCYCGINVDNNFASGSGFFITRDCVNILLEEIEDHRIPFEDVYIGQILSKHGISITPGATRYDIYANSNNDINDKSFYHFRCKKGQTYKEDYIEGMNNLFKNIKN